MPSVLLDNGSKVDSVVENSVIDAWRQGGKEVIENHTVYSILSHVFASHGKIVITVKEERLEMS